MSGKNYNLIGVLTKTVKIVLVMIIFIAVSAMSCRKEGNKKGSQDTTRNDTVSYDPHISDDYSNIANNYTKWGSYNLHDPTIIRDSNTYYIYSTDVMYGGNPRVGIMFRKSNDLVKWTYIGWVFNGMPASGKNYLQSIGVTPGTIWAPYILKFGSEFRLYYAVSAFGQNTSAICLATSPSPNGPWTDKGIVVSTDQSSPVNAIDPAVIIDQANGKHWMSFGSYSAGINIVQLDPVTGKPLLSGDLGKRIAFRTRVGDAIEGSEILYNPELKEYFLFVSYDWLEDSYNVRVGRSNKPEGPYYDFYGKNMAFTGDKVPIITAQYKFQNHPGWQGFGHCGLLRDGSNYYYVSQARLVSNEYLMDLHIHRMVWTSDGWPVISPERYVNVPQTSITRDSIVGKWEHIDLLNTASLNVSIIIELKPDGSITGIDNSSWTFSSNELILNFRNGETIIKAKVFNDWDWENKRLTICYSGLSGAGISGWGKKIK